MRVLAFRHAPFEDLGAFQPLLEERGVAVECHDLYRPDARVPDVRDAAGLIFMGGPMCANDELTYLHQEMEIMRQAAGRGQPMLGVCLGAQLLAKALGGRVYRNEMAEIGWFQVDFTPTGLRDPIFCGARVPQPVFQWHQDTFDLPAGVELLATAPACRNQAFRYGTGIYGLQFHPEVTPAMIEDWQRHAALCGDPVAPIDPKLHTETLAEFCERIVENWSKIF